MVANFDRRTYHRLSRQVPFCHLLSYNITSLAEFLEVFDSTFSSPTEMFWFRGHDDVKWTLCPSALRYPKPETRKRAIESLAEFRRIQEYRLPKSPSAKERFKWLQIAQHYGLPTRLLDWTQSLATALYFACEDPLNNGIVYAINPRDLNRVSLRGRNIDVVDPEEHFAILEKYFDLGPDERKRGGLKTIAVKPAWNSERIILQQGMFTFHGETFTLDKRQISSLIGVAILGKHKQRLRHQLERVGVGEMFVFPEPEHVCSHLKRRIELP